MITAACNGLKVHYQEADHLSEQEIKACVQRATRRHKNVQEVTLSVNGDFIDIECTLRPVKFQRIRRITGYLVGTVDRFNNGKRAEEHDRVKHTV
jgi:hypothetical protein